MKEKEEIDEIDNLLFLSKNIEKIKKRRKIMSFFLIVMAIFVTLETSINGKCFFQEDNKLQYFYIDLVMYLGVVGITISEIIIQQKKIVKKYQSQIRVRAKMCNLIIYQGFVFIIYCLSLFHVGVQIYFFFFDFNQDCFYFQKTLSGKLFIGIKILIFILFLLIETVTLYFLCWIIKENYKALQNPFKFKKSSLLFRSQSNDIVLQFYGVPIDQN